MVDQQIFAVGFYREGKCNFRKVQNALNNKIHVRVNQKMR